MSPPTVPLSFEYSKVAVKTLTETRTLHVPYARLWNHLMDNPIETNKGKPFILRFSLAFCSYMESIVQLPK